MEQRRLGRAGLVVPAVGLGTWKVFNVRDDAGRARCEAVTDAAIDCGANLFDSSPMYGESERVLADAVRERRDESIIATKVWAKDRAVAGQQIAFALDRFETIDLYQVHNLLGADEHLDTLNGLRMQGRVRAVGATHYLPSAFGDLMNLMRRGEIDVVQVPYHPAERTARRELLPACEHMDVGVIAMMPLGSGRLMRDPATAEELAPLAPFGVHTWAQALLKWTLSDSRVHAVVPATSKPDHMRENAAAGQPPWFTGDERLHVRRLVDKYC